MAIKLSDLMDEDIEESVGDEPARFYSAVGPGFIPSKPVTLHTRLEAGVYEIVPHGMQMIFAPHVIRTDTLIRAKKGAAIEVINEIAKFWTLREKFQKFGFMHKRGFLLYGPPGTGKTSTLDQIMADTVEKDGLVVLAPVAPPKVLVGMLRDMREVEPERRLIVVLEDLDNLIRYGESELLSLLDGEHAIDNVVYLATTNYIARLPARVVNRPSRFDRQILIAGPDADMRTQYLVSRGIQGNELEQLVKVSDGLSMAHLKELIISVVILGNDLNIEAKRLKMAFKGQAAPEES